MALLGEDGLGFELARKLESLGIWRPWLGDASYANFIHYLSSPSSWDTFMRTDNSQTRAHNQVQLRARALLFDKASVSLLLNSNNQSSSSLISKLNPQYLQLHGDDVYFTLENSNSVQDGVQHTANVAISKAKSAFGVGSRYSEPEMNHMTQRIRHEELPETWYCQFFEKYRASKPYRLSYRDKETDIRTPEQMFTYHKVLEKHKRRRVAFREDQNKNQNTGSILDDEETIFFPETMFTVNCVPDNALPRTNREELYNQKVEFNGVLDNLPQIMTRSPIMIERLGIRPEYVNTEHGGKSGRVIGQDQAVQISKKVVARILTTVGFEAGSEVPMEVLSQLLSCHACKLGRILKVLADNYRKQCSAVELIKMFLHTAGYSNLVPLAELVKNNTRSNVFQPTQQQMHPQMLSQHHNPLQQSQQQQITRQMQIQQMQQMLNPQNMTAQQKQQWERIRRQRQQQQQQQLSAPRPVVNINNVDSNSTIINNSLMKDRLPMVQVKLENPSDFPMESANLAFNPVINNSRQHPQMQFRQHPQQQQQQQQHLLGGGSMSNILHSQTGNQFARPLTSLHIPQNLSPNMGMVRAPPVKVEGFQELMGGDSSLKHEENKLTSPK